MLAKSCVLCCVSHDGDGDDHGVRRADTARAHARWQHIVIFNDEDDDDDDEDKEDYDDGDRGTA